MASYAVIAVGGKQYRVHEGDRLVVDRLPEPEGAAFAPSVLATGDGGALTDGGTVTARIEEHLLGPKLRVFTYKPKSNQRRTRGHRSRRSRVVIESIGGAGDGA